MTIVWIVTFLTGICFLGNNQASTGNEILTDGTQWKDICTRQSSGSFTFCVKSCTNVNVWLLPSIKIGIGYLNGHLYLCFIQNPPRCSNAFLEDILDCSQLREFNISWNTVNISLWKVVSGEIIPIFIERTTDIYVENIRLASYSGNEDVWRFNTTWNINSDFSCVESTTDYSTTVKESTGSLSNDKTSATTNGSPSSKLYETNVINTTSIGQSTISTTSKIQDTTLNHIGPPDRSSGTVKDPSPKPVVTSDGNAVTVHDKSPTPAATSGESSGTVLAQSTKPVATSDRESFVTVQFPMSTPEASNDRSLSTVQIQTPTPVAISGESSGTVQDKSPTIPISTSGESSGTVQDQLLTMTIPTSGSSDISSSTPSYTGTQSSGKDTTSFYSADLTAKTTFSKHPEISSLASDQTISFPYLDFLKCRCPCAAISKHNPFMYLLGRNLSTEELIQQMRWRLDEIKASLMINKTDTVRYKSKKISVNDNRASSTAIGWIGGVVLASVVLILVAIDLLRVRQFFTKVKTDAHVRKKKRRKKEDICPKGYVTSRL